MDSIPCFYSNCSRLLFGHIFPCTINCEVFKFQPELWWWCRNCSLNIYSLVYGEFLGDNKMISRHVKWSTRSMVENQLEPSGWQLSVDKKVSLTGVVLLITYQHFVKVFWLQNGYLNKYWPNNTYSILLIIHKLNKFCPL